MSDSSVPLPTFGPAGFVAPAESAILAGRTTDINTAFGGALNPAATSPQGQLASSDAKIIGDCYDLYALMANGVDPAYASGRFQDAIGRIYFIERNPAQPTVCEACVCTGAPGTVLSTTSAIAQDANGNLYRPTTTGTIGTGGTVTLNFACTVTGPIACPAGSLSVYQLIAGWVAITNPTDGVLGNVVESRADFEARRQLSVAKNASGFLAAIIGSVLSVPTVLDAVARDNSTNGPVTAGGVTIAANSLYVCVAGGDPQAVAQAIWLKKPPGCAYTGNSTQTVYDMSSGYAPPYPAYSVTFQTASALPVYLSVNIANTTSVPSNAAALIQAAVINAFSGADGGPRARIGSEIFASRFYSGIAMLGAWAQIVSVFIGTSASPTSGTTLQVGLSQVPTISASNIALNLV